VRHLYENIQQEELLDQTHPEAHRSQTVQV
jgi:hypothetical protein